eukprot:Hpha_TRINITY_DN3762_c0_g2::TRINITY_DN3762_c0_g2_i1::g.23851::m.23851
MPFRFSTAVSDTVLGAVCIFLAKNLYEIKQSWISSFFSSQAVTERRMAQIWGLLLVGTAAICGAVRFLDKLGRGMERLHEFMAATGKFIGVPLVVVPSMSSAHAAEALQRIGGLDAFAVGLASLFVLIEVSGLFSVKVQHWYRELMPTVFVVLSIVDGIFYNNHFAVVGGALIAGAGLGIGSALDEYWLGVRHVDWFHYILAGSMYCYTRAANQ